MADSTAPLGGSPAPAAATPASPAPSILNSEKSDPAVPDSNPTPAQPAATFDFYKDGKPTDAFLNAIPETHKTARALLNKYPDMENLAKGLEGLQYLAGQKGFEKPADDAPQSVKDAFSAKMRELIGVPAKAEDYGITKPDKMPEGMTWDEESAKGFAELALKNNMSKEQVKAAIEFQTQLVSKQMEAYAVQQAKQLDEARATLRQTYGSDLNKAIAKAQGAAEWLGLGQKNEDGSFNIDPSLGNNPKLIMALNKIADKIGESNLNPGTSVSARVTLEEQARELGKKASEAQMKGNLSDYKTYSSQQKEIFERLSRK